jgi:hypothetical protein
VKRHLRLRRRSAPDGGRHIVAIGRLRLPNSPDFGLGSPFVYGAVALRHLVPHLLLRLGPHGGIPPGGFPISSAPAGNDYFGDSCLVDVDVDTEISNRLGLTNATVSSLLAGAFSGAPIGTFCEGNRAVTILLRLDPAHRESLEDVRNAYIPSPITHASVPLRSIAQLAPEWQTSRIVRRNGVRTLTVRAFPRRGHYASEILQAIPARTPPITLTSASGDPSRICSGQGIIGRTAANIWKPITRRRHGEWCLSPSIRKPRIRTNWHPRSVGENVNL